MHYYVITGGPLTSKAADIIGKDHVIAADRGIDFCLKYCITPEMAVGDMDSVSEEGLESIKETGIPIMKYPVEKDMTDTEIALTFIPEDDSVTVVCPLTGRLDHIIANIQISAKLYSEGRNIVLDDGVTEVNFLSGNDSVTLKLDKWGNDSSVSLVPLSADKNVEGVTLKGLYYPLDNATLSFGKSLSFSNRPKDGVSEFTVSIKEGLLAVIVTNNE